MNDGQVWGDLWMFLRMARQQIIIYFNINHIYINHTYINNYHYYYYG